MDYARRLDGLRRQMAACKLGLVVYGPSPDLQYLTGLGLDWRTEADAGPPPAALFVSAGAEPILVLPENSLDIPRQTWIEDVRTFQDDAGLAILTRQVADDLGPAGGLAVGKRLGDSTVAILKAALPASEPGPAEGLMDSLRMIKEPEEIDRLRRVAKLTDDVFHAVIGRIREGMTQPELEAEIRAEGISRGAEGVSFNPAVIFTKSGSEPSAEAFTYPRQQGLAGGTSIAFDIGFVMDGYCSDFGRSLYFGPAPGHIRGAYEALQQAVVQTVAAMRAGAMRMCDLFGAVEKTLDSFGYGDYLRARLPGKVLGHNIGIDIHEDPWINPGCDMGLQAGMVMALEPKLWHSGEYYLRVEDIVLIGEDSSEFLTTADRTVFEL